MHRETSDHDHNRRAWNARAQRRKRFTRPAGDDDFANPLAALDGRGWLADGVAGKRVLCLAAGGGRQGPLYAAAGAVVTVVDISKEMLALDRQVAAERGLEMRLIEATMDDLATFESAEFDIVAQPVSTCYVPDVRAVYRAVARVLTPGGLYISQHKQPACLQGDAAPQGRGFPIVEPYYRRGPLPPVKGTPYREDGTLEYLHRWEELIGGLCQFGFVVEDLCEPCHAKGGAAPGTFAHRSLYLPPYVRIKARRIGRPQAIDGHSQSGIWMPVE